LKGRLAFQEMVTLVRNRAAPSIVRREAIQALFGHEKRAVFPILVELLQDTDATVQRESVLQSPRLGDSRLLFTLINLFEGLEPDSARGLDIRAAILKALSELRDPRSMGWLKTQVASANKELAGTAEAAVTACDPDRLDFSYTYIGPDQDLLRAKQPGATPKILIRSTSSFHEPAFTKFMRDERHGELSYALFVVLPEDPTTPFNSGSHLVIAPWRTEHYMAAQGGDVLSAGVVGMRGDVIEEITNQSGGYYPSPGSFEWVRRALDRAKVPFLHSGFSQSWPPDGYDAEGVLSRFPLSREG
jgi:hypothetical protein